MSIYDAKKGSNILQKKQNFVDLNDGQGKRKRQPLFRDNRPVKVAQRALQSTIDTSNKANVNSTFNDLAIPIIQREKTEGYKEAEASANRKPLSKKEAKALSESMLLKAEERIEALRLQEEEKKLEHDIEAEKPKFDILNLMDTKKVRSSIEKTKNGFNVTTDIFTEDDKMMAKFQNIFEVKKGKIIKMHAGSNVKSKKTEEQPKSLDKKSVPINMNEIIHLQYNIVRRNLSWKKNKKTDLEGLSKDQGISLKDFPFVIERGPTPGTDTANALRYLIQNTADDGTLIRCVIGSPHFSAAFYICRNLGLSMDNVKIEFYKDNPVITIHR